MQGPTAEHRAPALTAWLPREASLPCAHGRAEQAGQEAEGQLLGWISELSVKRGAAAAEQQEQPLRKAVARNPDTLGLLSLQ